MATSPSEHSHAPDRRRVARSLGWFYLGAPLMAEAWVRALGPDRDTSGLEVSGDEALAEQILAGLTSVAARRAAAA